MGRLARCAARPVGVGRGCRPVGLLDQESVRRLEALLSGLIGSPCWLDLTHAFHHVFSQSVRVDQLLYTPLSAIENCAQKWTSKMEVVRKRNDTRTRG